MSATPASRVAESCARLGVPRGVSGAAVDLLADELHALWSREYANLRGSASYRVGRTLLGPLIALRDRGRSRVRIDWPRVEPLLHALPVFQPGVSGVPGLDEVTAIIPTRDRLDLLGPCVRSLTAFAPGMPIVILDNGSSDSATQAFLEEQQRSGAARVIRDDQPFNFARLNNAGVAATSTPHVLLLNNDVEATALGCIEGLLAPMADPRVGVVGARLDYPDGRLQHAGIALGVGGVAGHPGRSVSAGDAERLRFPVQPMEWSAVTAACMLVRRSAWEEAGGMDTALAVAFNDVDLCLRAGAAGWKCVVSPSARLVHREGRSRGADDTPEKIAGFYREFALMRARWGPLLDADPCFPPELARAIATS